MPPHRPPVRWSNSARAFRDPAVRSAPPAESIRHSDRRAPTALAAGLDHPRLRARPTLGKTNSLRRRAPSPAHHRGLRRSPLGIRRRIERHSSSPTSLPGPSGSAISAPEERRFLDLHASRALVLETIPYNVSKHTTNSVLSVHL